MTGIESLLLRTVPDVLILLGAAFVVVRGEFTAKQAVAIALVAVAAVMLLDDLVYVMHYYMDR